MRLEDAQRKIIVALDVGTVDEAIEIVEELGDHVGGFKVGFEFIFAILAMLIADIRLKDARHNLSKIRELFRLLKGRVLLDCKLADIPNTMGKAVVNIVKLRIWGFNFHASAGSKSIEAAVKNAGDCATFGVTVLTSVKKDECLSIFGAEPNEKVAQFAEMLVNAGATGVICSAAEGPYLRGTATDDHGNLLEGSEERALKFVGLKIATPGIRPLWAPSDDQQRVVTPHQAINVNRVDLVIIGRPILNPPLGVTSRVHAAQLIAREIAEGHEITAEELIAV
ncbi:MAG: orotidine-5'-phosphate decarboxylase [Patescibacteria group bacterium]|nr:orotidine-5'-phosphate decarboxylase [Patescibacteria group bacterium]